MLELWNPSNIKKNVLFVLMLRKKLMFCAIIKKDKEEWDHRTTKDGVS